MKIEVAASSYPFFAALASETRLKIINLLAEKPLNIGQLAESYISAIVTRHINLRRSRIVKTESITGKRGRQKLCSLAAKQVLRFSLQRAGEHKAAFHSRWAVCSPQRPAQFGLAQQMGYWGSVMIPLLQRS